MYIVIHAHQGTVKLGAATTELAVVSEEMNAVEYIGWNNGYLTVETTDPGGATDGTLSARKAKEEEYKKQDEAAQKERDEKEKLQKEAEAGHPAEEAKKGKPEKDSPDHRAYKDETPAAHRSSR